MTTRSRGSSRRSIRRGAKKNYFWHLNAVGGVTTLVGGATVFLDLLISIDDRSSLRNALFERLIFQVMLQSNTAGQFVKLALNLAIVSQDAIVGSAVPEPGDQGRSMFMKEYTAENQGTEFRQFDEDIRPRRRIGPTVSTRPIMVFTNPLVGGNIARFHFSYRALYSV